MAEESLIFLMTDDPTQLNVNSGNYLVITVIPIIRCEHPKSHFCPFIEERRGDADISHRTEIMDSQKRNMS